jgi:hypothetical protein
MTPALTIIQTKEWDSEMRTVAALWRRRDGAPDTHLGQLLAGIHWFRFTNAAELLYAVLTSLDEMNPKSKEEFIMVRGDEPALAPKFIYHLWLTRPGRHENLMMPEDGVGQDGVPYLAVFTPKRPGTCDPGQRHFKGRLETVDPEVLAAQVHGRPLPYRPTGTPKLRKAWLTEAFYAKNLEPLLAGPVEAEC